jgi:hypothetical protein
MNEKFQTLFTRLRPHRVAILVNAADPHWQGTCQSVIEYLSQQWGGYQSMIVPTDGKIIDVVFWRFLSAFDPDVLFYFSKRKGDIKRWSPAEGDKMVEDAARKFRNDFPDALIDDAHLRDDIMKEPVERFSISDELSKEILERLSPFHFEEHYNIMPIHSGDTPGYPLTKVADVVPSVQAPDAMFVLNDNLPPGREAPPALWLYAETGIASPQLQWDMQNAGVTPVPKHMNTETDDTIIGWGIHPEIDIGPNTPFGFSRLALATVRSSLARPYSIPNVIVRGDTLKDFCLHYALSRNNGRSLWLPEWFLVKENDYPGRLIAAIRKLEKIGRSAHCEYFSMLSMSLSTADLRSFTSFIRQHITTLSISVDHPDQCQWLKPMLDHPAKVYIKKNIDRITTHQIIDEKLPGYFESPLPEAFSEVNATKHRWIVEVSIAENPIPRHPALGARFVTGHNVHEARASIDGLAYQCPGALVMGDDLELQMLRVEIAVPSADTIFRLVLQHAGYQTILSDKGRFASETTLKMGGLDRFVAVMRDEKRASLLRKFLDHSKNQEGVHDQGAMLTDKRRYMDFTAINKILAGEDLTVGIIDDWIARGILYRGFILKCSRCLNTAWFSVENMTQMFTCPRCSTQQQYRRENWLTTNEPPWHYKLDEIVYQFLHHNGDVALLAVDVLQREAQRRFMYSSELMIRSEANPDRKLEIDICSIVNNKIVVGEAKSNGSLKDDDQKPAQVVAKYRSLAKEMGATAVVFATTEPAWDEASQAAIDSLRQQDPLLWVYNFRGRELMTKR